MRSCSLRCTGLPAYVEKVRVKSESIGKRERERERERERKRKEMLNMLSANTISAPFSKKHPREEISILEKKLSIFPDQAAFSAKIFSTNPSSQLITSSRSRTITELTRS